MDRRDFLKVGGAAAVTAGAGTTAATGAAIGAPVIRSDATELRLATRGHSRPARLRPRAPRAPHRTGHRRPLPHRRRRGCRARRSGVRPGLAATRPAPGFCFLRRSAAGARPRLGDAADLARGGRRPDAVGRACRPLRLQATGGGTHRAERGPVGRAPSRGRVGPCRRPRACRGPCHRGAACAGRGTRAA